MLAQLALDAMQLPTSVESGSTRRVRGKMLDSLDIREIHKHTAIIAVVGMDDGRDDWHTGNSRTALADSTTSRVSYTLDSSLDSVNKIEQVAEQCAQRAGFDEDTIPQIAMAVREAAVNAVLHGNAYDSTKHITASFETTADSLIIRVADQGLGLDPDKIPDPLAPENILRGSGRGIFLIKAFMDEVNFRQLHPGTELTLIKHRTPAQPGT